MHIGLVYWLQTAFVLALAALSLISCVSNDVEIQLRPNNIYLIEANPGSGYHWPFKIYLPENLKDTNRLMIYTNRSTTRSDDFNDHIEWAMEDGRWPYIQLIPVFPRFIEPENIENLSPQYLTIGCFTTSREDHFRVDLQLINMIDRARELLKQNKINTKNKFFIYGYSSAGFFATRFISIHPEIIEAAAIGGHYWTVVPTDEYAGITMHFNYGTHDILMLTGKNFNSDSYMEIKQFIFMGQNDSPIGPIHYGLHDIVGDSDQSYVEEFESTFGTTTEELFNSYKLIFENLGFDNVTFRLYIGEDHYDTFKYASTDDVLSFFAKYE
jgi:hypothetical protein